MRHKDDVLMDKCSRLEQKNNNHRLEKKYDAGKNPHLW